MGNILMRIQKNRIAGLRQTRMTYEEFIDLLKKENVKTSLSAVKRIGLSYEIKEIRV